MCEEEALGGHGDAGGAAVFALDDLAEAVEGELATAYVEQGAGDGAHHVAQEAVAADGEDELGAYGFPVGLGEVADVGLDLGVELGEGGEVVVLHKDLGGLVHELDIGGEIDAAVEALPEGEALGGDVVLVGAGGGVEAGVGVGLDGEDGEDGEVGGEEGVELEDELLGVDGRQVGQGLGIGGDLVALGVEDIGALGVVEMGVVGAGVDAGIGAAAAHYGYGGAQQGGEGLLDGELHGGQAGLGLVAVVVGAVVG